MIGTLIAVYFVVCVALGILDAQLHRTKSQPECRQRFIASHPFNK